MATITVNPGDNLQTAIDDASSGDVLDVRSGTYVGRTVPTGRAAPWYVCFYVTKPLTIQRHAGDARPIITYDPANPPYDPDSGSYHAVLLMQNAAGIHDIILDGLEIVGMNALGTPPNVADNVCANFAGAAANCAVRNCVIRDGNFGILMEAPNGLIENNEIYNMGLVNPDSRLHGIYGDNGDGMTIRYNYVHHCTGYGIHDYSSPVNHKIYGNVITHNGGGLLVTGSGHTIVHNTISWNEGGGVVPADGNRIGVIGYSTNSLFENNLVWGNGKQTGQRNYGDMQWDATQSTCTFRNNCYHTIGPDVAGQTSYDASDLRVDPQFVSDAPAAWSDLRLKPTSPCLRAGAVLASPYDEGLDGIHTPGAWPPARRQW